MHGIRLPWEGDLLFRSYLKKKKRKKERKRESSSSLYLGFLNGYQKQSKL